MALACGLTRGAVDRAGVPVGATVGAAGDPAMGVETIVCDMVQAASRQMQQTSVTERQRR